MRFLHVDEIDDVLMETSSKSCYNVPQVEMNLMIRMLQRKISVV